MSRRKRRQEKRAAQAKAEATAAEEKQAKTTETSAEGIEETPPTPFWERVLDMVRENRQIIQFVVVWAVLVLIASSLLQWEPVVRSLIDPFTEVIARIAGNLIKLFGTEVTIDGAVLQGSGLAIQIMNNCNAVYEMFIFSAAVIAFPTPIKNKVVGIVLGLLVIYLVNLARVLGLFYIGTYMPNLFEGAHIYVAQIFFIVFVAMVWIFWIERFTQSPPANAQNVAVHD